MDGHVHGYFSLFTFTGKFCVLFYNNNNNNKTVKGLNPGVFQKVEFDRLGERSPE